MFQKSSYKKNRPNIIKSFLPLVGKGQQIIPRKERKKERKNTKNALVKKELLSPFANFCLCFVVVCRECLFLKGFLSVVVVLLLLACLLISGVLSNHEGIVRVLASQE
jgi:hypothetical protein